MFIKKFSWVLAVTMLITDSAFAQTRDEDFGVWADKEGLERVGEADRIRADAAGEPTTKMQYPDPNRIRGPESFEVPTEQKLPN